MKLLRFHRKKALNYEETSLALADGVRAVNAVTAKGWRALLLPNYEGSSQGLATANNETSSLPPEKKAPNYEETSLVTTNGQSVMKSATVMLLAILPLKEKLI